MKEIKTRFPDDLHAEAVAYAASAGVSLNALVMLGVRQLLDHRRYRVTDPERRLAEAQARKAEAELRRERIVGAMRGLEAILFR